MQREFECSFDKVWLGNQICAFQGNAISDTDHKILYIACLLDELYTSEVKLQTYVSKVNHFGNKDDSNFIDVHFRNNELILASFALVWNEWLLLYVVFPNCVDMLSVMFHVQYLQ